MADSTGPRAPQEVKTELAEVHGKLFHKVYVGPTTSHGLVEHHWIYICRSCLSMGVVGQQLFVQECRQQQR